MSRSAVAEALVEVLGDDELTVPQVMAGLRRLGARVPRTRVERTLADDDRFVDDRAAVRARWRCLAGPPTAVTAVPATRSTGIDVDDPLAGLDLHDWQVAAFAAWAAAGTSGVVEAVTGSGKTRLALACVRVVCGRGGRALVLVPTIELVEQWVRAVRTHAPGLRVGRLGAGRADDLHDVDVLVATPHSVSALGAGGPVPALLPRGCPGLLVADEAHRYGAPTWARALLEECSMRLALTATYERNDDGVEDVLGPYFGGIVYGYDVADAVRDGVVAGFRLAVVRTALDPSERERHDRLDRRVRRLHGLLRERHGFPSRPRQFLARAVEAVGRAEGAGRSDEARHAADYLSSVRGRREVAALAAGKLTVLRSLAPGIAASPGRALVFTDTVDQAELAARLLRAAGLAVRTLHGDLSAKERGGRMKAFRDGGVGVLVAPRVLDEGVDVPEADVAIVLANFRTRRQLVQRLGRVLRRKADGRDADFVLVCATDTAEDPARGAHREFLATARAVASRVREVDADDDPVALARVLGPSG